jgi:cation diffusion facilitator CzcD-associated flavoprotein CzcO
MHLATDQQHERTFEVAVIGAGPGGIAAAVKLLRAGIDDLVVLERSDEVGGSWHENHYPGIGVDVPAIAYQYSFARNAAWSRVFPRGAEVKKYHVDVAERFGVRERVLFGTEVERELWDDDAQVWNLELKGGGSVRARFLISAVGAFVRPKADVGIPGRSSFRGKVLRPADWDHDYDLAGKRVAIVGTGASAVQIIPTIAPEVDSLTVFQRTPVWSLPKPDFPVPAPLQWALRVPGVQPALHGSALAAVDLVLRAVVNGSGQSVRSAMERFDVTTLKVYRRYLDLVVEDPTTRAALTPNFGPFAKRPTLSNSYLRAFNRSNVALETTPIDKITPTGIRTRDQVLHKFDAIILATGYEVFSDPETYRPGTVVGRDGFDLAEFYDREGLQAYQSVSVHGLPNRWTLVGPYSWTGSGWHAFVEMTADHAIRAITETRKRGADTCEIRKAAAEAYHDATYRRGESLRYYLAELNGHVPTYYRNSQGDTTYIRPSGFFEARRGNLQFPLDDYEYAVASQDAIGRRA